MNSATYAIDFYTDDGTLMYQDSWSTEKLAKECVTTAIDMPIGSFAVISRVDEGITEIFRHVY